MGRPTVHIIGAGLAGLSAAVRLSQAPFGLVVHEAARQAGGRCRSFWDEALGAEIDNGAHFLLAGDASALAYLESIGSRGELRGPKGGAIPFADLSTGERWVIRPGESRLPLWLFSARRRVPGARVRDYLAALRLLRAKPGAKVRASLRCSGPLYDRWLRPLLLSALNSAPGDSSALLAAEVLRANMTSGGRASRPLIGAHSLSSVYVDPALKLLRVRGAQVRYERRLESLALNGDHVAAMEFSHDSIDVTPDDVVILAAPAHVAASIAPNIVAPNAFNAMLTAHFRVAPPLGFPLLQGVVNGLANWIVAGADQISVTRYDCSALMETPREEIAAALWREAAALGGMSDQIPPWRVVRERRATFSATPEQVALRPSTQTSVANLLLAGDYVRTGAPATIESAVRSGDAAAKAVLKRLGA
jgi:squalene-associated FAD-dependent desaturase